MTSAAALAAARLEDGSVPPLPSAAARFGRNAERTGNGAPSAISNAGQVRSADARLVVRGSARDPLIGPLTSQAERRRVGHRTNLAPIDADMARPAPVG